MRNPYSASPFAGLCLFLFSLHLTVRLSEAEEVVVDANAATSSPAADEQAQFILGKYCHACHANGAAEGGLSFDELGAMQDVKAAKHTWEKALKKLRAELMPPMSEAQPSEQERKALEQWIIRSALEISPESLDPGVTTIRRLNRTEYRNTIRDLLGVDFRADNRFPADDTGHGFDNLGDVLSISPLLLEMYFDAASEIVAQAVPTTSGVYQETVYNGAQFASIASEVKSETEAPAAATGPSEATKAATPESANVSNAAGAAAASGANAGAAANSGTTPGPAAPPATVYPKTAGEALELSYYAPADVQTEIKVEHEGAYTLRVELRAVENYVDNVFDMNRCELVIALDGEELRKQEFTRQGGKEYKFQFDRNLSPGAHLLKLSVRPLTDVDRVRELRLKLEQAVLIGPQDPSRLVKPRGYERFFPKEVPADLAARREYARELLNGFAQRAFRRPVDAEVLERLVALSERQWEQGDSFELGVSKAMTAVLVSPRFIFRQEFPAPGDDSEFPLIDEYSLASRLSYLLWSTMPDEELMQLAAAGRLRDELPAQIDRMLADTKSKEFVNNFVGQWLRSRAVESHVINGVAVVRREMKPDPEADAVRKRFFELRRIEDKTPEQEAEMREVEAKFREFFRRFGRANFSGELRLAMRQETEMFFAYVLRQNRSLLELIDSDYTFLNEKLAEHYGIAGVTGAEMRKVDLPPDSPRGGVLTQGTILAITSNPDRTSPVKRGLFILENLLGTPPPAPPPNVPSLEDGKQEAADGRKLSLRESLAIHRQDPLCASCHNQMDPLGLALENFNAMGKYRELEFSQPIETAGQLATGETFANIGELKAALVEHRRLDFYRCITEKLMIYALGREATYADLTTMDGLVDKLEQNQGTARTLLDGVIHSTPFQRMRKLEAQSQPNSAAVSLN